MATATLSAGISIAALPPDVLRSIFARFDLCARLHAVSLVCRRWRHQVLLTETTLEFVHKSDSLETAQPDGSSCLDRCAFTRARTRHAVNAPLTPAFFFS